MLLTFRAGPEDLADDPVIIHRMARGLYDPDGLALCFNLHHIGPNYGRVMITMAEASQRLRKILVANHFPVYQSRWRPVCLDPVNGHVGTWVRLRPRKQPADWVHDRPLRKRRARTSC